MWAIIAFELQTEGCVFLFFFLVRFLRVQSSLVSWEVFLYPPLHLPPCARVDSDCCSSVSDGSFSLFSVRKKIRAHLQFVLIKQGLHLRAPISCWCLFPFAIYFIPAAPHHVHLTPPTSFSKQKINRLEVTWLPASSFLFRPCRLFSFLPFFPGRTERRKRKKKKKSSALWFASLCPRLQYQAIRKHLMSQLF